MTAAVIVVYGIAAVAAGIRIGWTKRGLLAEADTRELRIEADNLARLLSQALDDRQTAVGQAADAHAELLGYRFDDELRRLVDGETP